MNVFDSICIFLVISFPLEEKQRIKGRNEKNKERRGERGGRGK